MNKINRRKFIRGGLLLAGATIPLPALADIEQSHNFTKVTCKVHSNGKPLPGISISDGRNWFKTDQKGSCTFFSISSFVFIKYPSAFQLNVLDNGSVDFFRRLDLQKEENQIEFDLKPLDRKSTTHHFVVMADPQVQTEEEAIKLKEQCIPEIKKATSYLEGEVFGIGCGDLVFDKFDLFDQYHEAVKASGIPFFQVLGNHDIDLWARSQEQSQYPFTDQFGPTYYAFDRGNCHYIVLCDVYFLGNGQYYGYLEEMQLSWLEAYLKELPMDEPIVIFLHIPVESQIASTNHGRDKNRESVVNRQSLYDLLSGRDVHFISGHVHWNENIESNGFFEHNTAAISGAWWQGEINYDGTPKGFGLYHIKDKTISWKYLSIGQAENHQFRMYALGKHPDFKDEVAINVWNWDSEWKIFWYENGVKKGVPEQRLAKDPLAMELYAPGAIKKYNWISAQRTPHMFFFRPENALAKISVEVFDRFGNRYFEEFD